MKREKALDKITLRVTPSLRTEIKRVAQEETRTVTNIIKHFIAEGLKARKRES